MDKPFIGVLICAVILSFASYNIGLIEGKELAKRELCFSVSNQVQPDIYRQNMGVE